jgi:hypothetical protein
LVFDDPDTPEVDYRIEDNGDSDGAPGAGVIQLVIDERPDGLYAIATAISKPIVPFGPLGIFGSDILLDVKAFRYPGSLDIRLTDTDFDSPRPTTGVASINGGIIGGSSIAFSFFGDTANEEFGMGFEIVSVGPFFVPEPDIDIPAIDGPADPVGSLTLSAVALEGEQPPFDVNGAFTMKLELQCTIDADCDDGLFCTGAEFCEDGTCFRDLACSPGEICDEERAECDPGEMCDDDGDCDDGLYCNGQEHCDCFDAENDCPDNKVLICHVPRGNPENAREICVGSAAVNAHLQHGDDIGACIQVCRCSSGSPPCDEDQTCDEERDVCMNPASRNRPAPISRRTRE